MQHTQQLNDKDIAADVLTGVKTIAQGYMVGVLESRDQRLKETFKDYHDQCLDDHERIFNVMYNNGWYKVPMILDESQ